MPRSPLLLLLALLITALVAAPAQASPRQESQIQDDPILVYGTERQVERALEKIREAGADRVRVTLQWRLVAPDADSRRRPDFNAADHQAYGDAAWRRYDTLVFYARQKGLGVNFNISAPGPRWAMRPVRRKDIQHVNAPSVAEFGRFVYAAATRYGPQYAGGALAVDFWSIWNEPNQGAWLSPQWARKDGRWIEWAPHRYRRLVDIAWQALQATGHGKDTILIGELAPGGASDRGRTRSIKPRRFLRALYCVDSRGRRLHGRAASRIGCPRSTRRFAKDHPALFRATGFSHHPYSLLTSPRRRTRDRDSVAMADLPRLRADLRRAFRAHRVGRSGMPIYLTEYGYQSNPPDPYAGVSASRQAAWLNEAEYMAYRRPYVRMVSQFLLRDDAPDPNFERGSFQYWRTFQTGLLTHKGKAKPSWYAWRVPIHLTKRVKPRIKRFRVWGGVRPPAADAGPVKVALEWRSRRRGASPTWREMATATTSNPRGYVQILSRLPAGPGQVRLVHDPPSGGAIASRVVNVSAR